MRPYENIEIIEDEPEWDDEGNTYITCHAIDTTTGRELDSITLQNPSHGLLARYCREHGWNICYDDTIVCPTCHREEMEEQGIRKPYVPREHPRPRGRRDRRRRDRPGYRPNPRNTGIRVEPERQMIEIGDILRHKEYDTIVKIEDVMQQDGDEGYRVSVLTDNGVFEAFMPFRDLMDYEVVERANPGNTGSRVEPETKEQKITVKRVNYQFNEIELENEDGEVITFDRIPPELIGLTEGDYFYIFSNPDNPSDLDYFLENAFESVR